MMNLQTIQMRLDEKTLQKISNRIATEVANSIYYEFLMARYLPEIKAIERGRIKALKGKEAKQYIKQKLSSTK